MLSVRAAFASLFLSTLVGPILLKPAFHLDYENCDKLVGFTEFYPGQLTLHCLEQKYLASPCNSPQGMENWRSQTFDPSTSTWELQRKTFLTSADFDLSTFDDATVFYNGEHALIDTIGYSGTFVFSLRTTFSKFEHASIGSVSLLRIFSEPYSLYLGPNNEALGFKMYSAEKLCNIEYSKIDYTMKDNQREIVIKKEKLHPLNDKTCTGFYDAYCEKGKCIWMVTFDSDPNPATISPGASGLFYKLAKQESVSDNSSFYQFVKPDGVQNEHDNWIKLDYGSEVTRYKFAKANGILYGIGHGSMVAKCRKMITTIRTVKVYDNYITQYPSLQNLKVVSINGESSLPKRLETPTKSANGCSGVLIKLPKLNINSQFYVLRYTFGTKNKETIQGGYRVTLRYDKSHGTNITFSYNKDNKPHKPLTHNNISYNITFFPLLRELKQQNTLIGYIYGGVPAYKGTLVIVVDNGIIEYFIEDGAMVHTESFKYQQSLFNEVCIQGLGSKNVYLHRADTVVYNAKESGKETTQSPEGTTGTTKFVYTTMASIILIKFNVTQLVSSCIVFLVLWYL